MSGLQSGGLTGVLLHSRLVSGRQEWLDLNKASPRRRKDLNPAHPPVHRMRHELVARGEVMPRGYATSLCGPSGPWAEEGFVATCWQAKRESEHTGPVKAGSLVVGSVLLLHRGEVHAVWQDPIRVVKQGSLTPTEFGSKTRKGRHDCVDDIRRLHPSDCTHGYVVGPRAVGCPPQETRCSRWRGEPPRASVRWGANHRLAPPCGGGGGGAGNRTRVRSDLNRSSTCVGG